MTALLEARGVSRDFSISRGLFAGRRLLRAVVDVDIMVDKGEVLGIVGESGSGQIDLRQNAARPIAAHPRQHPLRRRRRGCDRSQNPGADNPTIPGPLFLAQSAPHGSFNRGGAARGAAHRDAAGAPRHGAGFACQASSWTPQSGGAAGVFVAA
jgi:hypothetical protein